MYFDIAMHATRRAHTLTFGTEARKAPGSAHDSGRTQEERQEWHVPVTVTSHVRVRSGHGWSLIFDQWYFAQTLILVVNANCECWRKCEEPADSGYGGGPGEEEPEEEEEEKDVQVEEEEEEFEATEFSLTEEEVLERPVEDQYDLIVCPVM